MTTLLRKLLAGLLLLTFGTEETAVFDHVPMVEAATGLCLMCRRPPRRWPHGKAGRDIAAALEAAP